MSETTAPYTVATIPPKQAVYRPTALDPKLRLLLIAVRHACLILADALQTYCELPDKGVR